MQRHTSHHASRLLLDDSIAGPAAQSLTVAMSRCAYPIFPLMRYLLVVAWYHGQLDVPLFWRMQHTLLLYMREPERLMDETAALLSNLLWVC